MGSAGHKTYEFVGKQRTQTPGIDKELKEK
jgi:hypothetical protein